MRERLEIQNNVMSNHKNHIGLGKGPKIKKRESMVFDHPPPTSPPLTLKVISRDLGE